MIPPPPLERDFLWAILDQLGSAVFVKDRTHHYIYVNQAALDFVGSTADELIGKDDYQVFPKQVADFYRKTDLEMFGSARQVTVDKEVTTDANGRRRVLATTKVPLRASGGEVTHLVGVIQDITLLTDTEDALRAANEELERRVAERTRELANAQQALLRKERLAVLGRLVGGLAHQIRNPLGAIINAAALVSRMLGSSVTPGVVQALAIIHEEGFRANRIIVDLLDYARVRPAEPQPVELSGLLDRVLLGEEIPDAITVDRQIPPALSVLADRDQSEGALRNMVRNAIEAMPHGGRLTIAARQDGGQVVVTVRDTGDGIPEEIREHLFDPLVTTKTLGIGLGLSTARALVENQGGKLSFITPTSGGTCFEMRLPGI